MVAQKNVNVMSANGTLKMVGMVILSYKYFITIFKVSTGKCVTSMTE